MKKPAQKKIPSGNRKIVHDANNHLAAMLLSMEMLGMSGNLSAEQKKYLKSIAAEGKKIQAELKKIKD